MVGPEIKIKISADDIATGGIKRVADEITRLGSAAQSSPFQSEPGREAGRCASVDVVVGSRSLFQSAPGREAGRCLGPAAMLRPR